MLQYLGKGRAVWKFFDGIIQRRRFIITITNIKFTYGSSPRARSLGSMVPDSIKMISNDIVKSEQDKRSYRGLELKNEMKVILISDPETDMSSAALDVNVGHLRDPDHLPGLAHFCEHMLFLGTEKYPAENEYKTFLTEHGGSCNAFTASDHTNYYFSVAPEHLGGALDRFSQFFRCPLFTESATDREVNAVHSEHEKNLSNDMWRLSQLDKATCNQNHPFHKFGTGNKETLDEIPRSQGISVRDELLSFHSQWYSSNIMRLAVLGKETLDELQQMVLDLFSDVQNKNVQVQEWSENPFGKDELKQRLDVVPVMDIRTLNICFPIPYLQPHYKTSPGQYLGHLIGHEGPGSLLSQLKGKGWVNNLVGGEKPGARGFEFFIIVVDLTEDGTEHIEHIVTHMFEYLNMLRKELPQEWIFKECHDMQEMMFRFKDKEKPMKYTSMLSGMLHDYPMNDLLSGPYIMTEYKPELITNVLDCLVPDNVRMVVQSQKFTDKTDLQEKWYKTQYRRQEIPVEVLQKWRDAGHNPNLRLPPKNEFIPTNFDLAPRETDDASTPALIKETNLTRLWFKQDNEYLLPKAIINFEFESPVSYLDPLHCNMAYMLVLLFKDALTEYSYAAELAGLNYALNNTKYGIFLSVSGYNDKQHIMLEKIIDKLCSFEINPKRFEILKEAYVRSLKNFRAEQPHSHASYYLSLLMAEHAWTQEELLEATEELKVSTMQLFTSDLLSKLHIEGLIHGNISKQKALEMVSIVERKLQDKMKTRPLFKSQLNRDREFQLNDGCYYMYESENAVHRSSCIQVYYQCCQQETRSNVLLELFCQIINEPCYNILRTQEQLGYIVFSGVRRNNGVQGLQILIQSEKSPAYLDSRIEAFLHSMDEYIKDMPEEQFLQNREALATRRLEKPKKLSNKTAKFWSEIIAKQYNFERDSIEVSKLNTLTKDDVSQFYSELLAYTAPHRHKLAVCIISTAMSRSDISLESDISLSEKISVIPPYDGIVNLITALPEPVIISNITEFKNSLPMFPLPKPYINVSSLYPTKAKL